MVLAAYTGIRSDSLRHMTWSMIDWDTRTFRIPKEIMKTNSEVLAKIQDELFPLLVEWKKVSSSTSSARVWCRMNTTSIFS